MKLLFFLNSAVALLPVCAADPQPFAPTPFQLELPLSAQLAALYPPLGFTGVRLDLPIKPDGIDFGIPIHSDSHSDFPRGYDAPGAGYREQRDRVE